MQKNAYILESDVKQIVNGIFEENSPKVSEAYPEYGNDIVYFPDAYELMGYINDAREKNEVFFNFSVYYPDTKGFAKKEKIVLDPKRCRGHDFRFCISGWGVIQFQLSYKKFPKIDCRFVVNTEKRAYAWANTYPQLQSPSLWDWKLVEERVRRLIRKLQKHAQQPL